MGFGAVSASSNQGQNVFVKEYVPDAVRPIGCGSVENVAVGSQFIVRCPEGYSIHSVILNLAGSGALTLANLTNIRVKVNGVTQQTFADGVELKALNARYGRSGVTEADTGQITVFLDRPELLDEKQRQFCRYGQTNLGPGGRITIEATIAAATTPVVTATAMVSRNTELGTIPIIRRYPKLFGGAGEFEITDIPLSGGLISAIHLKSAVVTAVKVYANNRIIWEGTDLDTAKKFDQDGHAGLRRVWQTGYWHLDFAREGNLKTALNTLKARNLRIVVTLSGAGTVDSIVEFHDGWSRS